MSDAPREGGGPKQPLTCPKCRGSMAAVTFQEITVDRCTACGGLWFDVMEQRHLKDRAGSETIDTGRKPQVASSAAETPASKMICPCCNAPMTRLKDVDRRDVEYEYCTICNGAFFDGGEFRQYKDASFLSSLRHLFGRRSPR